MEITGKIIVACDAVSGVSQKTGNSWKSQEFVIETMEQYPKKCAFRVFGEDKLRDFNIQVNDVLKVYFGIDAREYNGRWFNSVDAWKVEHISNPQPVQQAQAPQQAQQNDDGLPF